MVKRELVSPPAILLYLLFLNSYADKRNPNNCSFLNPDCPAEILAKISHQTGTKNKAHIRYGVTPRCISSRSLNI